MAIVLMWAHRKKEWFKPQAKQQKNKTIYIISKRTKQLIILLTTIMVDIKILSIKTLKLLHIYFVLGANSPTAARSGR